MRIPRFYCPDISSDVLEIHDQKIIHHLIKVLRARQGQSVVLFDGNGKTFECEIKEIEKNKIKLDHLDSHTSKKENIITFNFFLPILKRESLISVATKLAELGVDKISLYLPDKADQSMAKKDFNKLTEKVTETLILACSQSGNNFIPKLKFFNNLREALDTKDGRIVMLDTLPEATSLTAYNPFQNERNVSIVTGCESGYSDAERKLFKKDDVYYLRTNILRAETAPVTILPMLKLIYKDI
tara:strand:- start:730 stop:1455 length:726 start_codon:yes stop_codon:yes gene_type:complete